MEPLLAWFYWSVPTLLSVHLALFGWSNQQAWDGWGMWHVWERDEVPFRQETNWTMSALGNGGPDSDPYGGPLKFVQSTKKKLYMQVFSRLVDITAGGDFLGLCDQKSSYKHVSHFGRLRSYGHFLIPVHALVWTASYGTSWRVMYSAWWLIVCVASIIFATWLAQFTTEPQSVLRPAVAFSKTSFKHKSIQIKGNFTKLTLHLYFKCIMYYAGLLFCSVYCQ